MKFVFLGIHMNSSFLQVVKSFFDLLSVISHIIRIDQNIIKINLHADIKEVRKYVVHEVLDNNRNIGKTKRYNGLFEGFIADMESSLLFVIFNNMDQVVSMMKIYLGIDASFVRGVQKVGNKQKQVAILFCNIVETEKVSTEVEQSIFLLDKKYGCSIQKESRLDKSCSEVLINEFFKSLLFNKRQTIDSAN